MSARRARRAPWLLVRAVDGPPSRRLRLSPGRVVRLAIVAGLLALSAVAFSQTGQSRPDLVLTSGTEFHITGVINSWPACTGGTVALHPGVTNCLTYTVDNTLPSTITVRSLSASASSASSGCPASLLDLSPAQFNGSLTVPAGQSKSLSEPISMRDNGNQDACKGVTVDLTYSGSGIYSELYATTAHLVSSSDPAMVGQRVTYMATVRASSDSSQDPVPSDPTGTVRFYDGGLPIAGCSALPARPGGQLNATASCTVAYVMEGTHSISAVFTNANGNFTGSTSNTVVQQVNATNTPAKAPSSTPSTTTTTPVAVPAGQRPGHLAFTGAQVTRLVIGALALLLAGLLLVSLGRRRNTREDTP
jgi:hypothetical protein